MKKLLIFAVLCSWSITAQQVAVTGNVTDAANGAPVPGVSVMVEGTTQGVATDFDGNYEISVQKGAVLRFSYVGYATQSIKVVSELLNVALEVAQEEIGEVVVTALGLKKEKKRVGYATQALKSADLQAAPAPNIIDNMAGRVAGLVVQSHNDFFSDPGISLRGRRPLMVIDGVPIDADGWNFASDDVESMTVLKGPAAAALYGSRGINGVIEVTLKRSARAKKKTDITVNITNAFTPKSAVRFPVAQSEYGPGSGGKYEYKDGLGGGVNDGDYSIWGPRFDGRLIKQWDGPVDPATGEIKPTPWVTRNKDNLGDFMQVAQNSSYNVMLQHATKKSGITISNTYKYITGSTPKTKLNVNNLRIQGYLDLTNSIYIDGSVSYNTQDTPYYPNHRDYGPHSLIYTIALWGGAHWDINKIKDYWAKGQEGKKQNFPEQLRYNNPWMVINEVGKSYDRTDIMAFVRFNWDINKKMKLKIRHHIYDRNREYEDKLPVGYYTYGLPRIGRYSFRTKQSDHINTDFIFSYKDDFFNNDLQLNTTLGGNIFDKKESNYSASTSGGFNYPGIFNLQNSKNEYRASNDHEHKVINSLYGFVDLSYKGVVNTSFSIRMDQSSSLPASNDTYYYPAVSLSFLPTDIEPVRRLLGRDYLSYLKLRASYSNVAGDLGTYEALNTFNTSTERGSTPSANLPTRMIDKNLEAERISAYEFGVEAGFWRNRIMAEVTYYVSIDGPEIFTQRTSSATGYTGIKKNGRSTSRKGWEVVLNVKPIVTPDFNWVSTLNWASYRRYLHSLPDNADGTPQEQEGTFNSYWGVRKVGDRLGAIYEYEFQRTSDGDLIIGDNGLPLTTRLRQFKGYAGPDFTFGWNNEFTYKNFTLSVVLDGAWGGYYPDVYENDLWRTGSHPNSVSQHREFSNQGIATVLIPGKSVVSGEIKYDNKGNTVSDTRKFKDNTKLITYETWAKRYRNRYDNIDMENTYIKLRSINISYKLPNSIMDKVKFLNSVTATFFARDLDYWTPKHTYSDPSFFVNRNPGRNLQLPTMRNFGLGIRVKF